MIWIKEFHLSIIPGRQRPVPKGHSEAVARRAPHGHGGGGGSGGGRLQEVAEAAGAARRTQAPEALEEEVLFSKRTLFY